MVNFHHQFFCEIYDSALRWYKDPDTHLWWRKRMDFYSNFRVSPEIPNGSGSGWSDVQTAIRAFFFLGEGYLEVDWVFAKLVVGYCHCHCWRYHFAQMLVGQ